MKAVAFSLLLVLLVAACGGDEEAIPVNEQHLAGPPTLLFAAMEPGGSWDVYAEEVASKQRTNLTSTAVQAAVRADDRSPVLSPDGTRIAYTSTADNVSDGEVGEEIFVMARDGSEQRRLTDDDDVDVDPQWTPAGRIFFTTCPSQQEAVPSCRLDLIWPNGSGRRTAVENIGLAVDVSLAPGGDRVAFAGLDEMLQPRGLFVVDLTSGKQERLADGVGPRWSPDGERIAFLRGRDVFVIDSDGSDERRLTETPAQEDHAGWTPDGKWVLFARTEVEADPFDLHAVRVDGDCEVQLTETAASETSPSWTGPTDSLDC